MVERRGIEVARLEVGGQPGNGRELQTRLGGTSSHSSILSRPAVFHQTEWMHLVFGTLVLLTVWSLAPTTTAADDNGAPFSVMSFNIRYGTANDEENRWERRRGLLLDVTRDLDADIIGLQEALYFQIEELLAALPDHRLLGVGRDDGQQKGEYSAILYRSTRFGVRGSGTFWFSDEPDRPGSVGWGNDIPRICTWARLTDADGRRFAVFNVHLDHRSQVSRERSAEALAARLAALPDDEPAIVTGDFNAGEDNVVVGYLTGRLRSAVERASGAAPAPASPWLVDTFRQQHPAATQAGTFSGFELARTGGPKIDFVFVDRRVHVLEAAIVRTSRDGRYPSDHFPVTARVVLP